MKSITIIPRDLKKKVDLELDENEKIEWMDMPVARFFNKDAWGNFLSAVFSIAFGLFWMYGASDFKIPDFKESFDLFSLFGVPVVLAGIWALCIPFFSYWKTSKTVYAITSERAITVDGGWSTTVRSFYPEYLQGIYRKEKKDGSGDVIFYRHEWNDKDGNLLSEELGFFGIRNIVEIEKRIKKLAGKGLEGAGRPN